MVKRIILVGSYPPRHCGIAVFTHDLMLNLQLLLPDIELEVCAMNDQEQEHYDYPPEVTIQIEQEDKNSYLNAADVINKRANETIVIVQHEYGVYGGGTTGKLLVNFLAALKCPVMTTFHTVVEQPVPDMIRVTNQIIAKSQKVVTLTERSAELFKALYPSAKPKLAVIKHGIHPVVYKSANEVKPVFKLEKYRILLNFGLLSRNKGIEYVIKALPAVAARLPDILYLIVGRTHPGVRRQEGEGYRDELQQLVEDLSLQKHVRFVDEFLPVKEILQYLQTADIYIASSLDPQQAVSGTLSYALGAGRPVIATSFSQAKEVVQSDIGRVVPVRDSLAITAAIMELLGAPKQLQTMNETAYAQTRSMLWSNVADDYVALGSNIAERRGTSLKRWPDFNWQHLKRMTDDFGMLQFAKSSKPQRSSGYTLDDNSRALQVMEQGLGAGAVSKKLYNELAPKYLQVISTCLSQKPTVNYLMADTKKPTKQNLQEDLSDSLARAYYALQMAKYSNSKDLSLAAEKLLTKLEDLPDKLTFMRSKVQLLLGSVYGLEQGDESLQEQVEVLGSDLVTAYKANSTPDWQWFDSVMTYANGQFCASLIEAARVTESNVFGKIGLESLEFLSSICFMGDVYVPIGQDGWYERGGSRSKFDQQPEDALAMMQALESAYNLTGDEKYIHQANKVFSWFMGNNLKGERMYDDESGGCCDGLMPDGVNQNQGAESTLSYLGARLAVERIGRIQESQELKTDSRSTKAVQMTVSPPL